MKSRFSTVDIAVIVQELKRFLGMRVVNVYDVDNKTYLIRIAKPDEKTVILMESGVRLHSTEFDWPKNPAPSGFSMKLRKHLKGRRFESIQQLGMDRIVDLQFGSGEAAYHIMLELYDRGNLALTDHEYTILTLLRPRTDANQDAKFAVREIYPINVEKIHVPPSSERIKEILGNGKEGDVLKKMLVPNLDYGPAIIDHALIGAGFTENVKLDKGFSLDTDFERLMGAIHEAESLFLKLLSEPCKGYIIQKKDKKPNPKPGEDVEILLYDEFHSFLYHQHENKPNTQFDKFDQAVDEFFSKLECQKLDMKVIQQEKGALKKLDNVRKDHEKRIEGLQKEQETDILRGQLIETNLNLVDQSILIVRNAVANQIDWTEIWTLVREAQAAGDPVATAIKSLKLDSNQITLLLKDPYVAPDDSSDSEEMVALKPMRVDIDLGLSAYGNSRLYFDKKKQAAKKEQKTMEASKKAFKSAEKKTKQTLKDVATAASINKTRKTYWFEKFLWFISSENYLVIGGRDQQQNELVVKRYMRPGDLYVHADLHGASSCIVKNPGGEPVPPKTLNEAGTMAICNSAAWDSKVVTSAWWVYHDQVSKTAPSGEYLTTGSFMVRGRKNYLPPSYLIYGFGFLFKLEESSVERHLGERKVRTAETDSVSVTDSTTGLFSSIGEDDVELDISDASDDETEESQHFDELNELQSTDEKTDLNLEAKDEGKKNFEAEVNVKQAMKAENKTNGTNMVKVSEEKKVGILQQNEKESAEKEIMFPDTSINLTHVKGDKYELQRDLNAASEASEMSDTFFLGDTTPVVVGEKTSSSTKRITAKQKREMRKQKKALATGGDEGEEDEEEEAVSWLKQAQPSPAERQVSADIKKEAGESKGDESDDNENNCEETSAGAQMGPAKRGQRAKKKKIKEKYADQDEDERRMRMEILASAGSQKEDKKKKGKKGKEPQQAGKKSQQTRPQSALKNQGQVHAKVEVKTEESKLGESVQELDIKDDEQKGESTQSSAPHRKDQDAESDGEKEDEANVASDEGLLNSLTGIPLPEDEILFAIPVCAPYSTLLNYKYKVKLMPGSTKKGKAVKTALNMFVHEKTATVREKDLLKIQKDVDLSRNVPGKEFKDVIETAHCHVTFFSRAESRSQIGRRICTL
ncbi:hypothetical protein RRG08_033561 [Elysia crispata]|uniref:Nuclear export mediator factor NEMF n=1 Tax=Elysia crispata TaxID=231223 RepID=A0AAE1CJI2_9GAST|nr:hypothetical protein RRG08_033561 [Elysia crispata]